MNIISYFKEFLEKNFMDFLNNYFHDGKYWYKLSDFSNYFSFMKDLDYFSNSFLKDVIIAYFEYIDNVFFHSSYRKNFCESKGFYERKNFVTIFGNISFKRRYYYDKNSNEHFFFVDFFLGLPKRKRFDPIVCSEIVDKASLFSYSKSGHLVAEKIGNKLNNNFFISRATARNIVLSFDPIIKEEKETRRIERLFIMLDEKFIPSQFNNNKDHMIKAAVLFEGSKLEYKSKRKPNSMDRYRLVNSHTCASITNTLLKDTLDFIYNTYDVNYLKELYFMGDCASWITNFPKSSWFKFNEDTIITFSMDGYHFSQAINNITTVKYPEWRDSLLDLVLNDDKELFKDFTLSFMDKHKDRTNTIIRNMEYILNNWNYRQNYQNHSFLKCSMESHISHIFADLFTSRPKAYSAKGLEKLLKIRLLKMNGYNLKEIYLNSFNKTNKERIQMEKKIKHNELNYHSNESVYAKEYSIDSEVYYPFEHNVIKFI